MSGRHAPRLGAAFVIATLLVGAFAAPAAANNPVRWVDDDAGGGGGPAACAGAAFTSIQDAIDASDNWDHVYVCPGTYTEQLTLDVKGIDVRSMPGRTAHIVPPSLLAVVDGSAAVVRMTAWAARLTGFLIDIPAGEANIIPFGPVPVACAHVDVAVLVLGHRSRVRRNVIDSIGDATFSGACGYDYGIVFGQHNLVATGLPAPFGQLKTSRAVRNWVKDFKVGGILVEGADYLVRVDRNRVDYLHADDPGCLIEVSNAPTIYGISPCIINTADVQPSGSINSAFFQSFGIGVEDDATAYVHLNRITSVFSSEVTTLGLLGPDHVLGDGVSLMGADADSRVTANTIEGVNNGIGSDDQTITASVHASAVGVGGAAIYSNTITNGGSGLNISDDGHVIYGNESHLNYVGIVVGGIDNNIHDNDFRGNAIYDCVDNSPAGSGTASTSNMWTNNLGNTDTPDGICIADI